MWVKTAMLWGAEIVNILCYGCAFAGHVHGMDMSLILDQFGKRIICSVLEGGGLSTTMSQEPEKSCPGWWGGIREIACPN